MDAERSVLLIGGPDAGKSNFLFRVWLAIEQRAGVLVSDGMPDDVEYLRTGADALLRGNFAPRTPTEVHNRSIVPVQTADGLSHAGQLVVPDCSGEKWLEIYDKREWSEDWERLIRPGTGCLIFVRAGSEKTVTPIDWISCYKQFNSAENPASVADAASDEGLEGRKKRSTPTQVMLIDWLQFLRRAFTDCVNGSYRPRIGIVVAAWDAVPHDQQEDGPREYLAKNFPMFEQFLRANDAAFEVQIFGVSVAGGDLANEPGFRDQFLGSNPHAAGYVIHALGGTWTESQDHTLPVAWALGFSNGTPLPLR